MPRAPLIASALALLLLSFPAQQSCRSTAQSSHIPNRISPVEYEVYSAWLAALEPDLGVNSYLAVRTIVFSRRRCEKLVTAALGPHAALLNQFDELGDAQYGLDFYSTPRKLKMPWPMQPAPEPPADGALSPYRVITFSRIAFDATGDVGIFAADNGGKGGILIVRKRATGWTFSPTGCQWIA